MRGYRDILLLPCGEVARSLGETLRDAGFQVREWRGREDVGKALDGTPPATILVGVPRKGRSAVVEQVSRQVEGHGAVVLALLPTSAPDAALDAVEAGADDVVLPPHSMNSILVRRSFVLRRREAERPAAFRLGPVRILRRTRTVQGPTSQFHLNELQFGVLACLLSAEGVAVPKEDLVKTVWGPSGASDSALNTTVHRLRKRLETEGLGGLIQTVQGIGYRVDPGIGGGRGPRARSAAPTSRSSGPGSARSATR